LDVIRGQFENYKCKNDTKNVTLSKFRILFIYSHYYITLPLYYIILSNPVNHLFTIIIYIITFEVGMPTCFDPNFHLKF